MKEITVFASRCGGCEPNFKPESEAGGGSQRPQPKVSLERSGLGRPDDSRKKNAFFISDSNETSGPVPIHCPVEVTVSLIGGKYKSLILWKLMGGTLRFSQLRREVPCATPKMLTQQLRELEADGLVRREIYPVVPPKVEYSLTEFGRSIWPVLESMYAWGTGYLHRRGLEVNCTMRPFAGTAQDMGNLENRRP